MTNLHCRTTSNLVLCCFLMLSLCGRTEAFSPNMSPLRPNQRIISSQSTRRKACGITQWPKRSISLATLLTAQETDCKDDRPSASASSSWKRIFDWRKPNRRFHSRRRFQKILPVLMLLIALPLKAVASDDAAMLMSPISASLEFRLTLRLVWASILGAGLGKERSIAKHSAGVRTMALVAMGASAFTVCSVYGFNVFGAKHDPGRMASQVASGVGFVGAGVITSSSHMDGRNIVHGLTTAATIWLSAAVGVACGTGLFQVATAAAGLTIFILRLGRIQPPGPTHWTSSNTNHSTSSGGSNNGSSTRRVTPSKGSADTFDWETSEQDDQDSFAETHDTSEWDEHPQMDAEMPSIIQETRQKIKEENHRLSKMIHNDNDDEEVSPSRKHSEHLDNIVVDEDPEMVEIMEHAWGSNSTHHHEIHIQNMQLFTDYANKTVTTSP